MPRKSTGTRRRQRTTPPEPPIQQRVVIARYKFGWLAVETSALGWRYTFGSAGVVTNRTPWQRIPAGDLNRIVHEIAARYERAFGVFRIT